MSKTTFNETQSDESKERVVKRRILPCDLIMVYERNNAQAIKTIKQVEGSKISPLIRATVFLSQRAGRDHGCVMSDDNITKLPDVKKLKGLPYVVDVNGVVVGQTIYIAELAVATGLVIEGYNNDAMEYRMTPVGKTWLRIVDGDGKPYRTMALRNFKKLKLVN